MPPAIAPEPQPEPDLPRGFIASLPIHPALALTLAGCVAIIFCVFLVYLIERPSRSADGSLQAWGGAPQSAQDGTSYGPVDSAPQPVAQAPATSTLPTYIPPSPTDPSGMSASDTFDMGAFLALLSQPTPKSTDGGTAGGTAEAYSFIPRGLISTSTLVAKRTALQDELFQYGNDAGGYIQSYEDTHRSISQILTDEIADRYNAQKVANVKAIGDALIEVGKNLQEMEGVPTIAVKANAALATSYIEIGTKLKLVADAKTDKELLSAVQTYNTAADTFTGRYIGLAQLFSGAGVLFAPGDTGSVFTFTNTQQL